LIERAIREKNLFDNHAEIAFNIKINPSTYLMGLNSPEVASSAKPGQFVMIRITKARIRF